MKLAMRDLQVTLLQRALRYLWASFPGLAFGSPLGYVQSSASGGLHDELPARSRQPSSLAEPAFDLIVRNDAPFIGGLHPPGDLHANVEFVHRINIGRRVRKPVGYCPEIGFYVRCIHTHIIVNIRLDVNTSGANGDDLTARLALFCGLQEGFDGGSSVYRVLGAGMLVGEYHLGLLVLDRHGRLVERTVLFADLVRG